MISFPMVPGLEIHVALLVFLSLAAGIIGGFVGVGGGFIMTPALIIMGFPAQFAVGTGMLWVVGNAIIGTLRHRRMGNVDFKLGLILILFTMLGVELGIQALNAAIKAGMAEVAVLAVAITAMMLVGGSVFWESARTKARMDKLLREQGTAAETGPARLALLVSRIKIPPVIQFNTSGVRISLWVLLVIGIFGGAISGFIGVGGGFIIVPSMVYIFGVPSYIAVGTSLFRSVLPSAFGAVRYTMDGDVIIFASFIMLLGSSAGVYFGAQLTRYLREVSMRYVLASTILIAVFGSVLKMAGILGGSDSAWLNDGMIAVTFGGLGLIIIIIGGLFYTSLRHSKGKHIPLWTQSLVKD
jgi:uncharacterized membrane protein YfcA